MLFFLLTLLVNKHCAISIFLESKYQKTDSSFLLTCSVYKSLLTFSYCYVRKKKYLSCYSRNILSIVTLNVIMVSKEKNDKYNVYELRAWVLTKYNPPQWKTNSFQIHLKKRMKEEYNKFYFLTMDTKWNNVFTLQKKRFRIY